jgi:hypothetical protein
MKEKHVRSEMSVDKKMKKIAPNKKSSYNEPTMKTKYSEMELANHKPMKKTKYEKRDKKVGKCEYV